MFGPVMGCSPSGFHENSYRVYWGMMAKKKMWVQVWGECGILWNHYKGLPAHSMTLLLRKFRVNNQSSTKVADRLALFLLSL